MIFLPKSSDKEEQFMHETEGFRASKTRWEALITLRKANEVSVKALCDGPENCIEGCSLFLGVDNTVALNAKRWDTLC